jgi:hypothetical protein
MEAGQYDWKEGSDLQFQSEAFRGLDRANLAEVNAVRAETHNRAEAVMGGF